MKSKHGPFQSWHHEYRAFQLAALMVLCFGTGAIYFAGIRPVYEAAAATRDQLRSEQSQWEQNRRLVDRRAKLHGEIAELRSKLDRADHRVPSQPELAEFIRDLAGTTPPRSIRNLAWQSDPNAVEADRVSVLPVRVSFDGEFHGGLVNFLERAQNLPRATRVQKLDVRAVDGTTDVRTEMTVDLFFSDGS